MKPKSILIAALFAAVSFVCGCASVTKQATNIYPAPKPDKGLVYVYREKKLVGGAISYDVRDNGQVVGAIANGTYFFVFADPGEHTYSAATETTSLRTINVEAGKTYYIEAGVEMGLFAGRPALKIASEAEAKPMLRALVYATK